MFLAAYVAGGMPRVTADDAQKLDLINIAFGTIKDGLLHFTQNVRPEIERLKAVNPELKVLLSIGGWGAGGFSNMSATEEGIAAFTASCMDEVRNSALDGIDIDWEYPTMDSAGIDASPADRENFTKLLAALRSALDTDFPETHTRLTIAAGAAKFFIDAVEIPEIVPLLDYVSLMTYDLAGVGCPATHHTALYPSETTRGSVDQAVRLFHEAGIPYEKLVIGAAFYSRRWTNIPDGGTHGLGQRCDDPEDKTSGLWGPGFTGICKFLGEDGKGTDGWYVGYDATARAHWLYHPEKREMLSFDDEQSVAEKVRYVKTQSLAGIMYWEHNSDPSRRLLASMAAAKSE